MERSGASHLHLLLSVLGRVLAALALPAQLLQLGLTLLQALPFALVLHLVFLQGGLKGATESRRDQLKRERKSKQLCLHREPNKRANSDALLTHLKQTRGGGGVFCFALSK